MNRLLIIHELWFWHLHILLNRLSEVLYRREENKGYVSLFLTIKNKIYISVCCFKNMFITSFQGFHLIKTCEIMILLLIDTLLVARYCSYYGFLYHVVQVTIFVIFQWKIIIYKEMYISFFTLFWSKKFSSGVRMKNKVLMLISANNRKGNE